MSLAQLGGQRLLVVGSAGRSDASVSRREALTRLERLGDGLLLGGVALLASVVPAARAARTSPQVALRAD